MSGDAEMIARGKALAASGKYAPKVERQDPAKGTAHVIAMPRSPSADDREPADESPAAVPAARRPRESEDERREHSGQVRMAQRLAAAYRDKLLHVHGLGWHCWDGKRWAEDDLGAAVRAVLDVIKRALHESIDDDNKVLGMDARRCESDAGIRGVLGIAAALPGFAATVRDLDADPYLLNAANGTVDLRSMELRPHRPADRITKVTRAAYDPNAPAAAWTQFLEQVLPDSGVREYLQRIIGVSLLGTVVEHLVPIWTGTGANGKSTAYKAILWALGDYASTGEPELFMRRQGAHPTGEFDLRGRRLVVVSESEEGRRLDEAKMKRLSGGDPIKARRMRMDFVEFQPSHLAMLITNHLPTASGDDPAVWRRLRVIPFTVVIPPEEQDNGLDDALQAEADAVLAWAAEGWQQYRERRLDDPPAVVQATTEYQRSSDAVSRFLDDDEWVVSGPLVKATTGRLHDAFERWRLADGAEAISQKAFAHALDRLGYPADKRRDGRWRNGIGLKQRQG